MSKEENKFDQWLQEQLDGHESQLPHASWSVAIQAKKRRKRLFIFLLASSGMAASLVAGYFLGRESSPLDSEALTQSAQHLNAEAIPPAAATPIQKNTTMPSDVAVTPTLPQQETLSIQAAKVSQKLSTTTKKDAKLITPKAPLEKPSPNIALEAQSIWHASPSIAYTPRNLNPPTLVLPTHNTRKNITPSWDLSLESGISSLSTTGRGATADMYNAVMEGQKLVQFHYALGLNRNWQIRKWQLSLGLQWSKQKSSTTYLFSPDDSLAFVGSGNPTSQYLAQESLSNEQLVHDYTSLSLPLRAQYRFYSFSRFEFLAGLGVNLNYNFNQNMQWYSPQNGNRSTPEPGTFSSWKFGQELLLSAGYRFSASKSLRLSYVLATPKGQLFENGELRLRSNWQHSLRLHYYIP